MTLPTGPPSTTDQSFGRDRRLRYDRHLRLLFERGRRLRLGPLTLLYYPPQPTERPVSRRVGAHIPECLLLTAVSVPKRQHRRATARNRIKRLLREAHRRIAQQMLTEGYPYPLWVCWLWQSAEVPTQAEVDARLSEACRKLLRTLPAPQS